MLMKAIELETSAGIYKHYDIVSYIFQIQLDYLTEFFIQFHTKNQKKMKTFNGIFFEYLIPSVLILLIIYMTHLTTAAAKSKTSRAYKRNKLKVYQFDCHLSTRVIFVHMFSTI